jgi:F-type H+-transporting ATPase subunit b
MLIDWFTVGAQALNFIILIWLLKRFLYKPILSAIDAREKGIAAELADANAKRAEALKEREDFQNKNKAFDEERSVLLSKAVEGAKAEGALLMERARKEAEDFRAREASGLRDDKSRMSTAIVQLAKKEVFEIVRKALADLADAGLEERMEDVFIRRLQVLDAKSKETLGAEMKTSSEPALIRTTFELSEKQRSSIQNALNTCFSAEIKVKYETAPDAVCGIELTKNGQKLSWSIAAYLKSLEEKFDALLDSRTVRIAPAAVAAPAPGAHA